MLPIGYDYIDRILDQEDALKLYFSLAANAEDCYVALHRRFLWEKNEHNNIYSEYILPTATLIKFINGIIFMLTLFGCFQQFVLNFVLEN